MTATRPPARYGVWSTAFRSADPGEFREAAVEIDELGFGSIWIPGGIDDKVLGDVSTLLSATRHVTVGTGIINVWKQSPADVGAWWRSGVQGRDRALLGLGISHGPLIGSDYGNPIGTMQAYLDGLDSEGVPKDQLCLAALGPRMLDLAAARTAGAHPYLVPPEHSAVARERMGPAAFLAPEQAVILETDPAKARALARGAVAFYLGLPNYVNNWKRLGYTEADVAGGPSDRLCDALFAWGTLEQIGQRVKAHLDAGADHVCLQVVQDNPPGENPLARQAWRELAALL
jgi:probable F420-dependent oxidoreductase